ncbi:hypothetical protein [Curtobacterium sp. MCBD17_003]|uniref:hypothetical protein n=1 Tax=Curtobacterium sp. MCBD17_003 TaxID=2175667 RepID=UPI000DAA3E3C|nr:hypothetical protein [Curtobacterium sp. MCBD17_003]WIE54203.1 hypothetical protein DEI88_013925 [Curtobacterium sp. MCBD17_003]
MAEHARESDPPTSHAAVPAAATRARIVEAVAYLYTIRPMRDDELVAEYAARREHMRWPDCDPESVRKRRKDVQRLDPRLQWLRDEKSAKSGKTVGVYGYTASAA